MYPGRTLIQSNDPGEMLLPRTAGRHLKKYHTALLSLVAVSGADEMPLRRSEGLRGVRTLLCT